jgi:hypothetical protein
MMERDTLQLACSPSDKGFVVASILLGRLHPEPTYKFKGIVLTFNDLSFLISSKGSWNGFWSSRSSLFQNKIRTATESFQESDQQFRGTCCRNFSTVSAKEFLTIIEEVHNDLCLNCICPA